MSANYSLKEKNNILHVSPVIRLLKDKYLTDIVVDRKSLFFYKMLLCGNTSVNVCNPYSNMQV